MTIELDQRLTEARHSLLTLPGFVKEADKNLDRVIEQAIDHLHALNEIELIRYKMGWTDIRALNFFADPEREPTAPSIEFSEDVIVRTRQFIIIGTYLRQRYVMERDQEADTAQHTKGILRGFFIETLNNLFYPGIFAHQDRVNGIDPQDRRTGNFHPDEEMVELMKEETGKVAKAQELQPEKLYHDVLAATEGGNFSTGTSFSPVMAFLENNRGDKAVREVLENALTRRRSNPKLIRELLRLLWAEQRYGLAMGIDLRTYYEINDYTDKDTIERSMYSFLTDPRYVAEIRQHVEEAAPVTALTHWQNPRHSMNYFDILWERTNRLRLPDTIKSEKQLAEIVATIAQKALEFLPLASLDSPRNFIALPTNMAADPRATNFTYRNREGQIVAVRIFNPRSTEENMFALWGHEGTHHIHHTLLKLAEQAGLVETGADEKVPNPIRENFAQLTERQFRMIWRGTQEPQDHQATQVKLSSQREWSDIVHATLMRRQAAIALTQLVSRRKMEERWKNGERDELADEEADDLATGLQTWISLWYRLGVPIAHPHQTPMTNISLIYPDDGLRYLGKYIKEQTTSAGQQGLPEELITMENVFVSRFGSEWLRKKDARVVLLGLLAESGNNHDDTTYGAWVQNADVNEIRDRLHSWGISEDRI